MIAILALQGAFAEHQQMLLRLGVESMLIRNKADWDEYLGMVESGGKGHRRGLIIPGGESTAMLRIMRDEGLMQPLREAIAGGMPTFGTCAGMIILARNVEGEDRESIALLDVTVRRNAYGRQLGSFRTVHEMTNVGEVPMTFIRAPYITAVGDGVEVLATVDGHIVAARHKNILVTSFHPELDDDLRIHKMFLGMSFIDGSSDPALTA